MKQKRGLLVGFLLLSLCSCQGKEKQVSVTYNGSSKQIAFAKQEIESISDDVSRELDEDYDISFGSLSPELGKESYRFSKEGNRITIDYGDETGAMYGGLKIADILKTSHSLQSLEEKVYSPYIEERGIKFNIPLDMRSPSYSDAGDSAQAQIKDMWDKNFWSEYFDEMARDNFNVISLWNLSPFSSMVKVPGYEDCALSDVWRTTLPFDASYSGLGINMVRPEHYQNYEVLLNVTIDEKIQYWKDIMSMAHDRGIKFYLLTWNVYTYGENGKYGIDDNLENPVTKDYYTKAVEAIVDTYPDLDGFGFACGENMSLDSSSIGDDMSITNTYNEQWIHDTYGLGIKDALSRTPERKFKIIHRLHYTDFSELLSIWKDIDVDMDFSDKYSIAHMYSSTKPTFVEDTLSLLPSGKKLILEVRNDDMFNLRWGDYQFAKDYLTNMPDRSQLRGFLMGSDGYVLGKEYFNKDKDFQGQLYLKKHFMNYVLFGKLSYDDSLTSDFFKQLLQCHFKNIDKEATSALYDAMQYAGEIIPAVSRQYFNTGDSPWYPEGNLSHPSMFGYLNIKRWINQSNVMPDGGCLSIKDYCALLAKKETYSGTLTTPQESAELLLSLSKSTMDALKDVPAFESVDVLTKEFLQIVDDQKAFALLGTFYGKKILSVLALREYNDLDVSSKKEEACSLMQESVSAFDAYADNSAQRYPAQWLSRVGSNDYVALKDTVKEDLNTIQNWKKRSY